GQKDHGIAGRVAVQLPERRPVARTLPDFLPGRLSGGTAAVKPFPFACRLLAVCVVLSLAGLAAADNWPQWRGPDNDGVCKETKLPVEWGAAKNVAWKLKMPGIGSSTPAVWGDRIFLTSADGKDLVLLCAGTDRKELWRQKLATGDRLFPSFRPGEGNEASPSPSTDGTHVYAYFGTGDFACFDFEGKEVWKFNAQERYGAFKIMHGMHITPLLH